jgi:hypothetical protein
MTCITTENLEMPCESLILFLIAVWHSLNWLEYPLMKARIVFQEWYQHSAIHLLGDGQYGQHAHGNFQ